MKTQTVIVGIVLMSIIGGAAFFGGRQYEKSLTAKAASPGVRNFIGGNRQGGGQVGQRTNQTGGVPRGTGATGNGFVGGEILSKDDKSLTLKTRDGGSTVVYFTDALDVRKAAPGTLADVTVGEQVTVSGKSGTDGIFSADSISILPAAGQN